MSIRFTNDFTPEEQEKYRDVIRRAIVIFERQFYNVEWSYKISNTNIVLKKEETESTNGHFHMTEPGQYQIEIAVNTGESYKYFVFILTHELSHLMFAPLQFDPFLDWSEIDNSTAITSCVRSSEKDGCYGREFEEIFANYIAHRCMNNVDAPDDAQGADPAVLFNEYAEIDFGLIRDVISFFGKTDWILDHLDNDGFPANLLTYCIIHRHMSVVMRDFDALYKSACRKDDGFRTLIELVGGYYSMIGIDVRDKMRDKAYEILEEVRATSQSE